MNNGSANGPSWKDFISCSSSDWDDYFGNSPGYGKSNYYGNINPHKDKRKHEFSPVVLVISTVWNCKHCGARQEDCRTEYCDEQVPSVSNEDDWDIGGWG